MLPPDGQWGIKMRDGNWTGMIGLVVNKVMNGAGD